MLYHFSQSASIVFVFSMGVVVGTLTDEKTYEVINGFVINDFIAACLIGIYAFGSFKLGHLLGKRAFIYFVKSKIGHVRAEQICRNELR